MEEVCPFDGAEPPVPEPVRGFGLLELLGGGAEDESFAEMLLKMEEPVSVPLTEFKPPPCATLGGAITGGGGGAFKTKLLVGGAPKDCGAVA